MRNNVSIVKANWKGENIQEHIAACIDLIDFKPPSSPSSIVIKPNLAYYWDASTGYTTDPKIVAGLIDYLRDYYGSDIDIVIAEADASAMKTKYVFSVLGYRKLAEAKKVKLCNLSEDVLEEKSVKIGETEISFQVPRSLIDADLFINVPKLKIMRPTHITCALKNIFGAIGYPRKAIYHKQLAETIVGINTILKPHLTLVDGLTALGRFPVRLEILMAGENPFFVDWVAAQVMGYNPSKIRFLQLAREENFGSPKDIVTLGEQIDQFRKDFPKENTTLFKIKWRLQLSLLRIYAKVVGDVVPPSLKDV